MNKQRMRYFEEEDVLHLAIAEGHETQSLELSPNITVELNERNELIGVEILEASSFFRDSILESRQVRMAQLQPAVSA
jgi:uncharacterized protein YuzE